MGYYKIHYLFGEVHGVFHQFCFEMLHYTLYVSHQQMYLSWCANGEVAPFVGHNAFLRWSALQDAAFIDPTDNKRKQWSERMFRKISIWG